MKKDLNKLLAKAIDIASTAHNNQFDKGGKPYILHPLRLMFNLRTDDLELMIIAVLHDVVEDCKEWTIQRIKNEGFTDRVVTALELLTHPKEEDYSIYIKRVATNLDAILIKLEDLKDNSDITRLKGISEEDFLRTKRYHKSYIYLLESKKQHLNKCKNKEDE